MACLSLGAIEHWLIWLVVIAAAAAIVWLLVSYILPQVMGPLGAAASLIIQVLKIVFWALVLIFVIVIVFDLLSCLVPIR